MGAGATHGALALHGLLAVSTERAQSQFRDARCTQSDRAPPWDPHTRYTPDCVTSALQTRCREPGGGDPVVQFRRLVRLPSCIPLICWCSVMGLCGCVLHPVYEQPSLRCLFGSEILVQLPQSSRWRSGAHRSGKRRRHHG